ncbi:MAG: hypothetical protein AAF773_05430 [Cyanobacteria bacterium P01_D01_bin.115]
MLKLRPIPVRTVLSTLAGVAIASGMIGIVGSGIAGLVAGDKIHKNRASSLALLSPSIGIAGFAGVITLTLSQSEN